MTSCKPVSFSRTLYHGVSKCLCGFCYTNMHKLIKMTGSYSEILLHITPYYEQQTGTLVNDQTCAVFVTIVLSSSSSSSPSFHYNSHTSYWQLYSSYEQINKQGQLSCVLILLIEGNAKVRVRIKKTICLAACDAVTQNSHTGKIVHKLKQHAAKLYKVSAFLTSLQRDKSSASHSGGLDSTKTVSSAQWSGVIIVINRNFCCIFPPKYS